MIKWNKVTWYSWYGALFLFLVILPVLSFYIGTQYELTKEVLLQSTSISPAPSHGSQSVHAQVSTSSPGTVLNKQKDFWGLNMGAEGVQFNFAEEPADSAIITLSRGTSANGPWKKIVTMPYEADTVLHSITDQTDGTKQSLYYRLEALSTTSEVLKSWGVIFIKRVSAQ